MTKKRRRAQKHEAPASGVVELRVYGDHERTVSQIRLRDLPSDERTIEGPRGRVPVVRREVRDDRWCHSVTDYGPNGEQLSRSYRVRDSSGYPPR